MIAFPFDSRIITYDEDGLPVYDRASSAAEFASLLSSCFVNGVFGANMCEVLAAGDMNVTVDAGSMLIEGRYGQIMAPETLTFPASEGLPRIDTVVLRLDLSTDVNYMLPAIVKGKADSSPVAPSLTRDGTIWELGIADVLIPANSTAVRQTNITDTRLDDTRCGLVAAVLTDINTTNIHAAFWSLLEEMRKTLQSVYDGVELVNVTKLKATLSADGWTEGDVFTQTVEAEGVLGADEADVDVNLSGLTTEEKLAADEAWSTNILCATTTTNAVVVEFKNLPEIDIPIKIKVVR